MNNEWSISSEGAKGAEIIDFSFLGGINKKVYIQDDNYFGYTDVYVDFLNLLASWIVLNYFYLTETCIKYKMSLNNMVYKKCSSYSFLRLKISQISEFYKKNKRFWKFSEFG